MVQAMQVLVVSDAPRSRDELSRVLQACPDVTVTSASCSQEALRVADSAGVDAAFVDAQMGSKSGSLGPLKLVADLWGSYRTPAVVVSEKYDTASIRQAMRHEAYAIVSRLELRSELVLPILEELRKEHAEPLTRTRFDNHHGGLLGISLPMQQLREAVRRVAMSRRPALVAGPTGSGKELVVRELHRLGASSSEPLLDINCGALPVHLIESQLFGHKRGSFTGADQSHDGFFTTVGCGTLFLDEIAELPLELQAKLLRVLESGTYRPVGSHRELRFRGRVVAATHANLEQRVREGTFREDLFYRINVLELWVPSLDERNDDIALLAAHFAAAQDPPIDLTPCAIEHLRVSPWPGNVRQLRNLIDRAAVFGEGQRVTAEVLRRVQGSARPRARGALEMLAARALEMDCPDKLQGAEDLLIAEALRQADGNKSVAARLLGVHRKVIERRMARKVADDDGLYASDASCEGADRSLTHIS
jgi:DNA-binding NtrC family response regulator